MRMAGDVHKLRSGKPLGQSVKARRVGRRLENQLSPRVPQRQRFIEMRQRFLHLFIRLPLVLAGSVWIKLKVIVAPIVGERDATVRCGGPVRTQCKIVLLWRRRVHGHRIHWSFARHQQIDQRIHHMPRKQKVFRYECFEVRWKRKPFIQRNQFVHQRRAAAPVADDEYGWLLDACRVNFR